MVQGCHPQMPDPHSSEPHAHGAFPTPTSPAVVSQFQSVVREGTHLPSSGNSQECPHPCRNLAFTTVTSPLPGDLGPASGKGLQWWCVGLHGADPGGRGPMRRPPSENSFRHHERKIGRNCPQPYRSRCHRARTSSLILTQETPRIPCMTVPAPAPKNPYGAFSTDNAVTMPKPNEAPLTNHIS